MVKSDFDPQRQLHFVQDIESEDKVYVSDRQRLKLYRKGIQHRQNWILEDYRLPGNLVGPGDLVIDVGANIGEIGRWVEANQGNYIAFEPDPKAYAALKENVSSEQLFQVALSDQAGTADFYLNTADADSSLFKPLSSDKVITVDVALLDQFLEDLGGPMDIRLLKVEAEGMEPEILRGAQKTLKNVEYLAVDAGPERGGENTVPGVFRALSATGFEVIDCYLRRGTFLFAKKEMQ